MATPYGGTRSKSFSTSQLRLGRTESLKEFAQVLQKQTTGRIRQTAEGFGRSAVSAALAPLPGPLQASMYGMLTSNPFSSSGDAESTVERISDDIDNLKNPTWAKNILRLFKEPLPVRIVEVVEKGQAVNASLHGVASVFGEGERVGIALESSDDAGEKLIECLLKV